MYIYHHICLDPRAIVMKLDLLWQTLLWPALIRRITDSINHGVCVYEPLVRWFIQRRNIWCHIWRNTCVCIYIMNNYIISHPLQQQLSLSGPRAVWLWHFRYDLAFTDLKEFRMRWQKDSTSRGSAEVCGPGPRGKHTEGSTIPVDEFEAGYPPKQNL